MGSKAHMNPILAKELRLGSRSIRIPLTVLFYDLFLAIIAVTIIFAAGQANNAGAIDYSIYKLVYEIIGWIQIGIGMLIIPILTAGSIAGEREKQTLELMLTTPKSCLSIVWGKLLAAVANYMIYIISSIPIMALGFILGGLNWFALFGYLVMMLILSFYMGAIGVYCSVTFKKTIVAIIMTFVTAYLILFMSITIYASSCAIVEGIISSLYYDNMWPKDTLNLSFTPLILMGNPLVGCFDYMLRSIELYSFSELLEDATVFGTIMPFVAKAWIPINIIGSLAITWLYLWKASRNLNPLAKKNRKVKNKQMQEALEAAAPTGQYTPGAVVGKVVDDGMSMAPDAAGAYVSLQDVAPAAAPMQAAAPASTAAPAQNVAQQPAPEQTVIQQGVAPAEAVAQQTVAPVEQQAAPAQTMVQPEVAPAPAVAPVQQEVGSEAQTDQLTAGMNPYGQ